jgi:phosphomannomutase
MTVGVEMALPTGVIVSVSGVRGVIGEGLTPELVTTFAAALGTAVGGGRVVVGRDSRPSGRMLAAAVQAGLVSTGCEVIDAGILPTPTLGLMVRHAHAAGGLQITASHNPAPWNGLKLFGPDGAVLDRAAGERVKQLFTDGPLCRAGWSALGAVRDEDAQRVQVVHTSRVLPLVDVAAVRARRPVVLLDANGGAGGPLGVALLEALGCGVVAHACEPDGQFLHPPEPTPENLEGVGPEVVRQQADVGFVLDPDADRLAVIDETGRPIGEELTLALAVKFRLGQDRGPVVVNLSTSRVTEDLAREAGVPFRRTPVGEANVVEGMRSAGALIGGEGNGGVIDPRVGWVRDPFIGMALVLNFLAASKRPLSELVAELPRYLIVKDKYPVDPAALPAALARLEVNWPDATADRQDGLRLDWPDRWVQVRASNTEPIVRVIAEAPSADDARGLCDEAGRLLRG